MRKSDTNVSEVQVRTGYWLCTQHGDTVVAFWHVPTPLSSVSNVKYEATKDFGGRKFGVTFAATGSGAAAALSRVAVQSPRQIYRSGGRQNV